MQQDFHYYATYCAALLAGYAHHEAMDICYSAELCDHCSRTYLASIHAPLSAATTQLPFEMANARTDLLGLQDITRIWSSFHFLPYDLNAEVKRAGRRYKHKYRLICGPNGDLVTSTVCRVRGKGYQSVGIAMHVLADTWAHRYFAGTPSLVINNMSAGAVELVPGEQGLDERPIVFKHSLGTTDDLERGLYTNTPFQIGENSIMNLGHGRAGHLPDYSFARYRYMPAWDSYREITKDNPSDYYHAFCQMVYAMRFLRGIHETFEPHCYDTQTVAPWKDDIQTILAKRQLIASDDWHALATRIGGHILDDFDVERHRAEYLGAAAHDKDNTFLGRFVRAALEHKSMVTNRIHSSGNPLAGRSIEYHEGVAAIKDYLALVQDFGKGASHE